MKTISRILTLIVTAAAGGVIALALNNYNTGRQRLEMAAAPQANQLPIRFVSQTPPAAPEGSVNFVSAASKSVPAVVHIQSKVEVEGQPTYNSLWDYFYGNAQRQRMEGMVSGSGVIISADGYIVTNNHVVEHSGKIEITLADRQTYEAKVIGKDPATDLALLKIDAQNLPYLDYGNSDDAQVGQWVLAVGNPYNLISTVTAGIISAKGRNIDMLPDNPDANLYPIESYIQTDAAVNPGNSGGALVNTDGQLIGINSAIASPTGAFAGYSFAIPVNLVKKVVADMLKYGAVQRAFLGVSIRNVDADVAKEAGLNSTLGVYINAVEPNGAAEAAGIQKGDVVMKIAGQEVNDVAGLEEQIGKYRPGDKIAVTVSRNGNIMDIPVILRNIDGNTSIIKPDDTQTTAAAIDELGATFGTVSDEEKQQLHIDNGVKVTSVSNGKLSQIGVETGFIITKIDHRNVNSPADIQKIIANKSGGVLMEGLYPNGMRAYYAFGV